MGRNRRHDIVKPSKYKTSMCSFFVSPEGCPFGSHCAFAHGDEELRQESKDNAPPPDAIIGLPSPSGSETEAAKPSAAAVATAKADNSGSNGSGASAKNGKKTDGGGDGAVGVRKGAGGKGRQRNRSSSNDNAEGPHRGGNRSRQTAPCHPSLAQSPFPLQTSTAMPGLGHSLMRGLGPVSGGFQSLAGMPYSTNSAVPNAPLYIPTNYAQHPFFNINNSNQFLNVMTEAPPMGTAAAAHGAAHGSNPTGVNSTSAAAGGGMMGQRPMVSPYLFFGPGAQQPQLPHSPFLPAGSSPSSGQRSSGKSTPGSSPQPATAHTRSHANVVSSNTLANAGHSRGRRNSYQQDTAAPHPLPNGGGGGLASGVPSPSTFAPFGANNTYANPCAPIVRNGGLPTNTPSGPSLQSILTSQAPPTVVHIPFESSGGAWGGDRGDFTPNRGTGAAATSSARQLSSFLQQQQGGNGYYAYTILPGACGLPAGPPADAASQPPAPPLQAGQNHYIEDLLASLKGPRKESNPLGRTEASDEDDDTKSTDWNAFLETWLGGHSDGGGAGGATVAVPNGSASGAADTGGHVATVGTAGAGSVPVSGPSRDSDSPAAPVAAGAAPRSFDSAALQSNPRPVALALSKPVVQLSGAPVSLAGPVPSSQPLAASAATGAAAKTVPRRTLLCAVSRAGTYNAPDLPVKTPTADEAKPPPRRRLPIMRNHFKSSCAPKEETQAPSGTSLLLYCAEKNTLYYITGPAGAERTAKDGHPAASATTADAATAAAVTSTSAKDLSDDNAADTPGNSDRPYGSTSEHSTPTNEGVSGEAGVQHRRQPAVAGQGQRAVQAQLRQAAANGDRIIRCRPPLKRYDYVADGKVDEDMEYCI